MNTIHRTTIVGKCPHGCPDIYDAEFHTGSRLITVESIQSEIDQATEKPVYQEQLTQILADRVGCEVVLTGTHGRFRTECRASPSANS